MGHSREVDIDVRYQMTTSSQATGSKLAVFDSVLISMLKRKTVVQRSVPLSAFEE